MCDCLLNDEDGGSYLCPVCADMVRDALEVGAELKEMPSFSGEFLGVEVVIEPQTPSEFIRDVLEATWGISEELDG